MLTAYKKIQATISTIQNVLKTLKKDYKKIKDRVTILKT